MAITDPAQWEDLFTRTVDERPVQFVRPAGHSLADRGGVRG
ncbi:hypothetical protein ACFVJ4_09185 [Streptomyces sp. NPDC127178]